MIPYGSKSELTSGDRNAKTKEPKVSRLDEVKQALIDLLAEIGDRYFQTKRALLEFLATNLKSSFSTLYKFQELWLHLITKNYCNAASGNENSDFDIENNEACEKLESAETFTESGVTVTALYEVLLPEVDGGIVEESQGNAEIEVSKFLLETSEPLPDNELKPIMSFDQQIAIASICKSQPIETINQWHKPKEPPRENPSTLQNVKATVTADPSKARSQLAMLKAKLLMPWLKSEERSQTEAAIAWLETQL